MKTKSKITHATVLDFFKGNECFGGATADEAVVHFGSRNYSTVTARITELRQKGKLETTGFRRMTRRGRMANVLRATYSDAQSLQLAA